MAPKKTDYHTYPNAQARSEGAHSGEKKPSDAASGALVSVILPIYNAEPYLDQALDSVQAQTHGNLDIICLNDGSTDGSLAIMRAHAAADPRIRIIDKENQGYGATCNRGLDEAHGEWVAIVEPDDWIEPGMYADMLAFAARFSEPIDIVKTPYWRIAHADTSKQRKLPCSYSGLVHPQQQPFTLAEAPVLFHHHPSIWSALYRKAFLDERGIRFKPIPGAGWADNPFLAETLCQAQRIVYLDRAYYCYREDDDEKAGAFHRRSPDIPFNRWNDMLDVLERLDVRDEGILAAHHSRAFLYLGGVLEQHSLDEPEVSTQVERMFKRMDPNIVFSYKRISPAQRKLYANVMGLPEPHGGTFRYVGGLIGKGFYNLRKTGVRETASKMAEYFTKHSARVGKR